VYKDHIILATALTQAHNVMCTLQIYIMVAASMQTHLEPVPLVYGEPLGVGKYSLMIGLHEQDCHLLLLPIHTAVINDCNPERCEVLCLPLYWLLLRTYLHSINHL